MTCKIEGCGKEVAARGWCKMHWTRWSRHGDPTFVHRVTERECEVDSCHRRATSKELCSPHRTRATRHGDVYAHVPIGALRGVPVEEWPAPARPCSRCDRDVAVKGLCVVHAVELGVDLPESMSCKCCGEPADIPGATRWCRECFHAWCRSKRRERAAA